MKNFLHFLLFFITVMTCPIAAKIIGNVEYDLPNHGEGWKISDEWQGTKRTSIFYIPEDKTSDDTDQFFLVQLTNLPNSGMDPSSLKEYVQAQFPNLHIQLNLLNKAILSSLYEWSAIDDTNQEIAHGWIRTFSTEKSIMLAFQTKRINDIAAIRSSWLPALKAAKLLK